MKANAKWAVAGLVLGLAVALTLPTIAQEQPPPAPGPDADRTVTTNGVAVVRSAPDEALVTLGVRTDADAAEPAISANADLMGDVIRALIDAGLDRDDLATASINLYPQWDQNGTNVVGFTAENQVTATIGDLDRVGPVIDAAVGAGANLASGISFRISNANEAADRALAEAVADARRKAEILAEAGGVGLGSVVRIAEASSSAPPPVYYEEYAAADGGATPVLPPTLETQVAVSVVWSLV